MAEDYLGGKRLSHTANQVDTVLDERGYVANISALAALTPPTHLVVVVGDVGVYVWVAGSTATADGVDVVASTVTGYVSAGRWIRKQASVAMLEATSEFSTISPAENAAAILSSGAGGVFYWASGDTSATDGQFIFKSTISPYGVGEASEGSWLLAGTIPTVLDGYSQNIRVANTATNNTTQLNAALANADTASGYNVVEITRQGAHAINGTITVPKGASLIMNPTSYLEVAAGFNSTAVYMSTHGNSMTTEVSEHVINVRKASNEWYAASPTDTASTGIHVYNSDDMHLKYRVENFCYGLKLEGNGTGSSYNTFYPIHSRNNWKHLFCVQASGGWTNENKIFGGRFRNDSSVGSDTSGHPQTNFTTVDGRTVYKAAGVMTGTYFIQLGASDNWMIDGVSMEGQYNEKCVDIATGTFNHIIGCRWEGAGTDRHIAVHFQSGATKNFVFGGYDAWSPDHSTNAIFIDDSSPKQNIFNGVRGNRIVGGPSPYGQAAQEAVILSDTDAEAYRVVDLNGYTQLIIRGGGKVDSYSPDGLYHATENPSGVAHPYVRLFNKSIYIGDGTAAPERLFLTNGSAGSYEIRMEQLLAMYDNLWITSGITASVLSGGVLAINSGGQISCGSTADLNLNTSDIQMNALPTSDPAVAGKLWNNSGVMNISAG